MILARIRTSYSDDFSDSQPSILVTRCQMTVGLIRGAVQTESLCAPCAQAIGPPHPDCEVSRRVVSRPPRRRLRAGRLWPATLPDWHLYHSATCPIPFGSRPVSVRSLDQAQRRVSVVCMQALPDRRCVESCGHSHRPRQMDPPWRSTRTRPQPSLASVPAFPDVPESRSIAAELEAALGCLR